MLSTHWFRPSWLASRSPGRKGNSPHRGVRPCLECLEDRTAPAALLPTTLVVNPIGPSVFGFTTQKETVTVQVNNAATGAGVGNGLVTIADAGLIQTVSVNSQGLATATFTFGLLPEQEVPGPHQVSASYTDPNSVFASSSGNGQAPDNTAAFSSQVQFALALIQMWDLSAT
jgi:hypothetical protein